MGKEKQKLALVFGNLPTVEEIDQFQLLSDSFEINVISSESICGYLSQTSRFQDLKCIALPDHDDNPTYLPGLESTLADYDVVIIKERLGLYAYQAVKAKWKSRFRMAVWVDNLTPLPADDVGQMRTIRHEVNNAADIFLVQSDAARLALELEGIEKARIDNFSPWVEQRITRTKKTKAHGLEAIKQSETSFVIAHLGQIEWEEGLLDLANAVKYITMTDPKFADRVKIVFCGIGSFGPGVREAMVSLGIDEKAIFVAPSRQAFDAVLEAADCLYMSTIPARDRVEGDPYRLLLAMTNGVPILATRSPIVEELCGKHRIDFCPGSVASLAEGIKKVADATSIRNNIVKKNQATVKSSYAKNKVLEQMTQIFTKLVQVAPSIDKSGLDHQVLEVEARVASKQYLAAIELIENIFQIDDLPVHHKANLYRLIGDCFAKLGDNDAGKDAYVKTIELDPYASKAYIGLGTIGLVKQSHDIAVIHFQKAVSLAPEDEMANLGLGLAFQGMDEPKEAARWVVKSLEINPENTAALYTLVKIAYVTNQYDKAEEALQRYVALHPNDHNLIFTLGGLLYKQDRFAEVEQLMAKIVEVDPMDTRAHQLMKQAKNANEGGSAETSNG